MNKKISDEALKKVAGGEVIQKSGITCPGCGQRTLYLIVTDYCLIEMCSRCTYFVSSSK